MVEGELRSTVKQFVERASRQHEDEPVQWLRTIAQRLRENAAPKVTELAAEVSRHPSWLGSAYHLAYGERLQETVARMRVERAARLLRETDESFAHVALDAGFCDQSHMNRTFARILGRSPSAARADRKSFRQVSM